MYYSTTFLLLDRFVLLFLMDHMNISSLSLVDGKGNITTVRTSTPIRLPCYLPLWIQGWIKGSSLPYFPWFYHARELIPLVLQYSTNLLKSCFFLKLVMGARTE
jgi:hypothetical protein